MRSLEVLLTLVNLLALVTRILPSQRVSIWADYLGLLALAVGLAQLLVEGPRWQLAPAYFLAAVLLLLSLIDLVGAGGSRLPSPLPALGTGLGILLFAVSAALPLVLPVFHFPKPTGPYAIGTTTYHWIDASRSELYSKEAGARRELMAQIWYPAKDETSAPRAPYMADADAVTPVMARLTHFPFFMFGHFRYARTNAVVEAPVADKKPAYPLLVYLTGQNGFRGASTFQIEELVSRGYIVVGLDQPGASALVRFPDGHEVEGLPREQGYPLTQQSVEPRPVAPLLLGKPMPEGIVPYFAADVSFALDRLAEINAGDPRKLLTGRLDLGRTGIFGISLGGIDAAEACLKDRRLRACLIMDVFMSAEVVKRGLDIPALWITRDAETMRLERRLAGGWTEEDIEQHQRTMRQVYQSLRNEGYYLEIPGIFHLNFTDAPYWLPISSQLGLTGPVSSARMFEIINAYTVAFFDKHLEGLKAPLLEGPSRRFPELRFETRNGRP